MRCLLMAAGLVLIVLVAACWTPYPYRVYRWLSLPDAELSASPEWIMVLGGGGIPSESGLMRTFYAARAAQDYPEAIVVIALPGHTDRDGSLWRMRDELVMRGVSPDRVRFEPRGTNTRSQAVEWARQVGEEARSEPLMIVTSPEHMRRSVRSFERVGFEQIGSRSAMDTSIEGELGLSEEGLDASFAVRAVEDSLFVRYQFWHGIGYMGRSFRELTALAYYRLKGWI